MTLATAHPVRPDAPVATHGRPVRTRELMT